MQNNLFLNDAAYKSKTGEIFLGGVNGFNAFYPDKLVDNPYIPPVVLTDFQIFNSSVNMDKQVRLSYDQSAFTKNKQGLDVIQRSGEHLLTLINDILEVGCNAFVEKFLALLAKLCSLEWVYETPETTISAPMEYPAAAEIEVLYNLAKMGKIKAIIDTSEALSINEPKLANFSKKVTQLAREFKIQELKIFLEKLLE